MNKKGTIIPLETLLGILIALLVFGTLWWGVSRFFRLSGQAESNFYDLADKIKEVSKQTGEPPEKFISIQDKETFVTLFTGTAGERIQLSYSDYFLYPSEKCEGKACLCFCRKYESGPEVVCSLLQCALLEDTTISQSWINLRTDNALRRVPVTIENKNGMITLTGGNIPNLQPRTPEESGAYDNAVLGP